MAGFFTRVKDNIKARWRYDLNQMVHEYDAFLQNALVTTSSFQNILDGKLNRKRQALQLAYILYCCLYLIPRYGFVSLLYLQDEETRWHYQYTWADCGEEMGMLGRTLNVGYTIFGTAIFINCILMRKFEGQGSLEFLTDWFKRIPKKPRIEEEDTDEITAPGDLDNESRHKLIAARIMARHVTNVVQLYELAAFSLFIYKRKPASFIICLELHYNIKFYQNRSLSFP